MSIWFVVAPFCAPRLGNHIDEFYEENDSERIFFDHGRSMDTSDLRLQNKSRTGLLSIPAVRRINPFVKEPRQTVRQAQRLDTETTKKNGLDVNEHK